MFLHALAYVTEKEPEKFNATLKELLERYPETDITPLASSYLKQMAQGRQLESGAVNMRGMLWDIRLTNDSVAGDASQAPIEFSTATDVPHLLILTYPTDTVSPNNLLYEVARHNFTSFVVKDFDLEQMNFGRLGLLIIKGFENIDELNHYRKVMTENDKLNLPPQVRPIVISAENFDMLLKQGRSFEEYFSFIREQVIEETEQEVLPTDDNSDIEPENTEPQEDTEIQSQQEQIPEQPSVQETPVDSIVPESSATQPAPIEAKTDTTATKPAATVQPQPVQEKQAEKPTESKKQNKPTPKAKPIPLPEYPAGSEGDDPLLDTP